MLIKVFTNSTKYLKVCRIPEIVYRSLSMEAVVDIKALRIKYKGKDEAFVEDHIPIKEPFNQFNIWMKQVIDDKDIIEPNAMCLSTCSKEGKPSARYVLLKEYGKEHNGFKFFTNSLSRKGQQLKENQYAAITFYWAKLNRQIRIEGVVEKLPDKEANDYFTTRPYASQIGALASDQSRPIPNREYLVQRAEDMQKLYPDQESVKKPSEWGGYKLVPNLFEFWQGQSDRVHDRIQFRKPQDGEKPDGVILHSGENGWVYERLAP